jgi:hypothetical protein
MILQGKTSRSLSWTGWLAVLGLGLLLLPLAPVRAAPPADDPQEQDTRDREIETLKKKLQTLEAQKRADREVGAAAAARARSEVDRLAREIETKRRDLQALEARLRDVKARLAAVGGEKKGTAQESDRRVIIRKEGGDPKPLPKLPPVKVVGPDFGKEMAQFGKDMGDFGMEIGLLAQKMAQLKLEGKEKEFAQMKEKIDQLKDVMKEKVQAQVKQKLDRELVEVIKAKVAQPKLEAGAKDKKPEDLERKLDRLLNEVDELRRELRREKR